MKLRVFSDTVVGCSLLYWLLLITSTAVCSVFQFSWYSNHAISNCTTMISYFFFIIVVSQILWHFFSIHGHYRMIDKFKFYIFGRKINIDKFLNQYHAKCVCKFLGKFYNGKPVVVLTSHRTNNYFIRRTYY